MASKKRTKTQIVHDRARIAELTLQQYTQKEIMAILAEETGIAVSQQQISYDLRKVRKDWLTVQHDTYDLMMMQELARIDALESETWRAMRDSVTPRKRESIEKARRKLQDAEEDDGVEYDMVITKTQNIIEEHAVNPAYFNVIQECQKERRRLLGLYAPQQIGVQKTVVIKGYKNVSPDDWDRVVEGELVK